MSATKRSSESPAPSSSSPSSDPPPAKIARTVFKPYCFVNISSQEELTKQTLLMQNRKLAERIEQRRKTEAELLARIEQLEKRQVTDDAVLCVINRYWNQLDEDLRIMLERFDAETADEIEHRNQSDATTSFLAQVSSWDNTEMEERLRQRVEFSTRAVGKLLQAFDRIIQRNERLTAAIQETFESAEEKEDDKGDAEEGKDGEEKGEDGEPGGTKKKLNINDEVKKLNFDMQMETSRLQALITQLEERHHTTNLKNMDFEDKVAEMETEIAELKNKLEDVEWDLMKSREKEDMLDRYLADALEKLKRGDFEKDASTGIEGVVKKGSGDSQVDTMRLELEEQKEIATNRLSELELLQSNYEKGLREIERLRMDLSTLPEHVIVESTEYKCLQSQFSVLYNESMQMRTQLEESRGMLQQSKTMHLRQIEEMESAELMVQKKLRTELIQLEDSLSQTRREYEMLRIEFEQNLAANEQTGPINREMRHLITSLQNHNQQLKGEVTRYKRKLKEAHNELTRIKSGDSDVKEKGETASTSSAASITSEKSEDDAKKDDGERREMKDGQKAEATAEEEDLKGAKHEALVNDLKAQLKKSQEAQKELKLLLDMYKTAPKEQRDKVELMAAEKRLKAELGDVKGQMTKLQESKQQIVMQEKKRAADEEQQKKLKKLEDDVAELERNLAAKEQEETTLLNEMEVTGQAFEDMQDQNLRLLQQLREKDDANFKLMSERIKSNQIQKLLREEKEVLQEQVATIHAQCEAQNVVVRKLEEKERILQNNLLTVEKESNLRQQAMELHKRKALESTQTSADLRLHLDKYMAQLKELQASVGEKNASNEKEAFKQRRAAEELIHLRKKMERMKKFEMATSADEVLTEELKEYKELMTCPSCKSKRKDAVLTKCFHVFCFSCVKTRYETRQRKCPKCNAGFGANDFHRIYIA